MNRCGLGGRHSTQREGLSRGSSSGMEAPAWAKAVNEVGNFQAMQSQLIGKR
jgi:hypothetical protein